jgi:hypothetical protein
MADVGNLTVEVNHCDYYFGHPHVDEALPAEPRQE